VLLAAIAGAEDPPLAKAAERVRRLIEEEAAEARMFPVSPLMMRAALAPAGPEAVALAERGFEGGFSGMTQANRRKVAVLVLAGRDGDAGVALFDAQVVATKAADQLYGAMGSRVARPTAYEPLSVDGAEGIAGLRVVEHLWGSETEDVVVLRSGGIVIAATISGGAPGECARLAKRAIELVRGAASADPWDGKTGEEARQAFVDALDSPSWGVRWRATRNLGRMRSDARSDAALARVLRDPDATVRIAALRALAARGWLDRAPAEVREALAADPDWGVRLAYRRLRDLDAGLPELLAVLDDPHPALRAFAFTILEKRDAEDRIPWSRMRAGIEDPDSAVRLAALRAFRPWNDDVCPSEAQRALVGALRDANPSVREQAAGRLRWLMDGSPPVVEPLVAALSDESPDVRREAVDALEDAGATAAAGVPALVRLLDDRLARDDAAKLLGRIGVPDEEALKKLRASLATGDPEFRFEAACALWRLGSAPTNLVDIVVETLRGDSYASDDAAEMLGELGELARPYVPDLVAALAKDRCRSEAVVALGRLGAIAEDALPELVRLRDQDASYVRRKATEAIRCIHADLARRGR
jgi:HEAT repeat protein